MSALHHSNGLMQLLGCREESMAVSDCGCVSVSLLSVCLSASISVCGYLLSKTLPFRRVPR